MKKQPLLLILAMLLFGVAIATAIWIFGQQHIASRRDEILTALNTIAADAVQYRGRPKNIGGGGGTYWRYTIPKTLAEQENYAFEVYGKRSRDSLIIRGVSKKGLGEVTAIIDQSGKPRSHTFKGEFE